VSARDWYEIAELARCDGFEIDGRTPRPVDWMLERAASFGVTLDRAEVAAAREWMHDKQARIDAAPSSLFATMNAKTGEIRLAKKRAR